MKNWSRWQRPTPVDEAKWGFSVIEGPLWEAVPSFLRQLESICRSVFNISLPLSFMPVTFVSWIGGDRDGNPNVTYSDTREVLLLSRQKCLDLYSADIQHLVNDLAVSECNEKLDKLRRGIASPIVLFCGNCLS